MLLETVIFGEGSVLPSQRCQFRVFVLIIVGLLFLPAGLTDVPEFFVDSSRVRESIIVGGEHHIDVPFYYQVKTYYCGPAALQMVFDYFGENVSQFEIAEVARTVPYVTYTDEMRRAAHFSNVSTSMGSEMAENITGYTARKLGYGAFEMYSMSLEQLKDIIDMDFPMILLMRWVPGEPYGHYRVAVGYNETHVFLHDPWNNVAWGGEFGGPNLAMNYTFFDEMWSYSGYWGLFVSPWKVEIEAPITVYVGEIFTVRAYITYVCPPPIPSSGYEASFCNATIILPEGLVLAENESVEKSIGEIFPGGGVTVSWKVKAERAGNYSVSVEAEGKIDGFVGEKPDVGPSYYYVDRIGGFSSSFVNAEVASQIYISDIKPSEGAPGTEVAVFGGGATPNGTVVALLSGPVNQTIVVIGSEQTSTEENVTLIANMTVGWTVADMDGSWSITFNVPDVSPGDYNVFVVDNGTLKSDVAKFKVLPLQPVQIKIWYISPTEGYPGTLVFIRGDGATAYGKVGIYFDNLNVANTEAYSSGSWSTSFRVPDVPPGNYTVLALDLASNTSDTVVFRVLEIISRTVGVKEGDWAKYNVSFEFSTDDPEPPITPPPGDIFETKYFLLKVLSITGTNVTYESVVRYENGTEISSVSWLDVSTGQTVYGVQVPYGPIIGANLTVGDKVYLNPYSPEINLTVAAFYAGLEREVNCLIMKMNVSVPSRYLMVGELLLVWDRVSGVLCEQKFDVWYISVEEGYRTHLFYRIVISETNIWAPIGIVRVRVTFFPGFLNLRSRGRWVICVIELPEGYRAKDVDLSSLMLNGTVAGEVVSRARGSRYLIVKFERKAVISLIRKAGVFVGRVCLVVNGRFKDGTVFAGTARVIVFINPFWRFWRLPMFLFRGGFPNIF